MASPIPEWRLAYMAGLIDAVGSMRLRNYGEHGLVTLQVCGLDEPIVDMLATSVGGIGKTLVARDHNRTVCREHCAEAHAHVHSRTIRWTLTGARATIVLAAVRPYLRMKADQADEMIRAGLLTPWKGATATKMTGLGWPIPARLAAVS